MSSNILKSSLVIALVAAVSFCQVQPVLAQTEMKVGFVDVQKALSLSKAGKKAQEQYEGEVKVAQKEIDRRKEEFETRRKSFDSQKESLNEKALADKTDELVNLERDLKRSFQDSQTKLRKKNSQIVGELVTKLREVVAKLGKEKGFTVILEKSSDAVLYADSAIDITEEVVGQFDSSES